MQIGLLELKSGDRECQQKSSKFPWIKIRFTQ
jgi:hypothetical protein